MAWGSPGIPKTDPISSVTPRFSPTLLDLYQGTCPRINVLTTSTPGAVDGLRTGHGPEVTAPTGGRLTPTAVITASGVSGTGAIGDHRRGGRRASGTSASPTSASTDSLPGTRDACPSVSTFPSVPGRGLGAPESRTPGVDTRERHGKSDPCFFFGNHPGSPDLDSSVGPPRYVCAGTFPPNTLTRFMSKDTSLTSDPTPAFPILLSPLHSGRPVPTLTPTPQYPRPEPETGPYP